MLKDQLFGSLVPSEQKAGIQFEVVGEVTEM